MRALILSSRLDMNISEVLQIPHVVSQLTLSLEACNALVNGPAEDNEEGYEDEKQPPMVEDDCPAYDIVNSPVWHSSYRKQQEYITRRMIC